MSKVWVYQSDLDELEKNVRDGIEEYHKLEKKFAKLKTAIIVQDRHRGYPTHSEWTTLVLIAKGEVQNPAKQREAR